MLGGKKDPCIPYLPLRELKDEDTGAVLRRSRPCPRIELSSSNVGIQPLLNCVMDERLRGLASEMFDAVCGHLPPDGRRAILTRIATTLNSERLVSARKLREEMELEKLRQR